MSRTALHLSKQYFKFSSAHFLIFDKTRAERLHGHNYQVQLDIEFPENSNSDQGYLVDFNVFKNLTRQVLNPWDEMVLLPGKNSEMKFQEEGSSLKVHFRDRFYVFPKDEVLLLPLTNTSTEQLSKLLAETLMKDFQKHGVTSLRVRVEETQGQGASTSITA